MQYYTNQKIIEVVHKESRGETFGYIYRDEEETALKSLRDYPTAYILYVHICLNQPGYTFGLSQKEVESKTGLTEPQYRKSVRKLIECGFLVQDETKKNKYKFYTTPKNEGVKDVKEKKKKSKNNTFTFSTPHTPTADSTEFLSKDITPSTSDDTEVKQVDDIVHSTSNDIEVQKADIIPSTSDDTERSISNDTEVVHQTRERNNTDNIINNINNIIINNIDEVTESEMILKLQEQMETEKLIYRLVSMGCEVKYFPTGYMVKEMCCDNWLPISEYEKYLSNHIDNDEDLPF